MSVHKKFILVLDIGSTSGRAFVFELPKYEIVGSGRFEWNFYEDDDGYVEINPEELFNNVIRVLRDAIDAANISVENILCLGIGIQRGTFIIYDRVTGRPYHNFCAWQDRRAEEHVKSFNESFMLKFINFGSNVLYFVTRKERFKQGSNIKLQYNFITPKLRHIIENNKKIKEAMRNNRAVLATMDTWLLFRLRNVQSSAEKFDPVSDISSVSATSFFDPFQMKYNVPLLRIFKVNRLIRPKVLDNSSDFGYTHKSLFGEALKIVTVISDQSASLIGNACFRKMDAKITLGTGAFFDINTGNKCMGSNSGANPMVAYDLSTKRKRKWTVYYLEYGFHSSSTIMRFAKTIGMCSNESELSELAISVDDTDGVYFLPNFRSLAGFVGMKSSTRKSHMVRAALESIVFNVASFFFRAKDESSYHFDRVRIDGGISQNDFICQCIADLINTKVERGEGAAEITSYGVAYLSAYLSNELEELEDAQYIYKVEHTFYPIETNRKNLFMRYKKFEELNKKFSKMEV